MAQPTPEFERLVSVCVARFAAQKSCAVPLAQIAQLAQQLGELVAERGLPPPLSEGECGSPGGMAEEVCTPLVARVIAGTDAPLLADVARQLVKACFYPEFRECRDSFREVTAEGACRRQQLERVRGRLSGTHCVDCPHWVALGPTEHAEFLAQEWRRDSSQLSEHRDIFLPEDFRALRRWLHAAARGR